MHQLRRSKSTTLAQCEAEYKSAGFMQAVVVKKIRDDELWTESEFRSFNQYCKIRLGLSRQRVHQLIQAVDVRENLEASKKFDANSLPVNESQYRLLGQAEEAKQVEIFEDAVEAAKSEDRDVITHDIEEALERSKDSEPSSNGKPAVEAEPDANAWKIPRSQSVKAAEALRRHVFDLCRERRRVGKRDRVLELTDEALQILKGW